MGEVVNIEEALPHMTGNVLCIECGNKWVAVAPIETTELECEKCGTMKGAWEHMAAPETCWRCGCGNQHFYIDTNGAMCARCGKRQEF